jgi:hypothetical protein
MRHADVRSRSAAALRPNPFSVGYITNIAGFEFPTGTGGLLLLKKRTAVRS